MNDAEFLRYLAQNDYMIDQYFLEDGKRLLKIADNIDDVAAYLQAQALQC